MEFPVGVGGSGFGLFIIPGFLDGDRDERDLIWVDVVVGDTKEH